MPLIIRFALMLGLTTLAISCDSPKPEATTPSPSASEGKAPGADGGAAAAPTTADKGGGVAAVPAKEVDAGAQGAEDDAAKGQGEAKKSPAGALPDPNFDLKAPSLKAPAGGPGLKLPGAGKKKPSLLDTKLKPGQ